MTTPLQILAFMAHTLAPAGTNHIAITSGNETYTWDAGNALAYDRSQLRPNEGRYAKPEDTLATNRILPSESHNSMGPLVRIAHHNWAAEPTLFFDEAHELQKTSQGFVYIVRPGDPTEKDYSFVYGTK